MELEAMTKGLFIHRPTVKTRPVKAILDRLPIGVNLRGGIVLKGSEQLFASKYRTVLPTEAELERERRVIEQKQNGGDT